MQDVLNTATRPLHVYQKNLLSGSLTNQVERNVCVEATNNQNTLRKGYSSYICGSILNRSETSEHPIVYKTIPAQQSSLDNRRADY